MSCTTWLNRKVGCGRLYYEEDRALWCNLKKKGRMIKARLRNSTKGTLTVDQSLRVRNRLEAGYRTCLLSCSRTYRGVATRPKPLSPGSLIKAQAIQSGVPLSQPSDQLHDRTGDNASERSRQERPGKLTSILHYRSPCTRGFKRWEGATTWELA